MLGSWGWAGPKAGSTEQAWAAPATMQAHPCLISYHVDQPLPLGASKL